MTHNIIEDCKLLLKAKEEKNFRLVLKIAAKLSPQFEKAYFSSPELFQDNTIKEARNYVRRLVLQRDFILQRDFDSYNEILRFTLIGEP